MRTMSGILLCTALLATGCGQNDKQIQTDEQISQLAQQIETAENNLEKSKELVTDFKKSVFEEVRKKHREIIIENQNLSRQLDLAKKEIKDLQDKMKENLETVNAKLETVDGSIKKIDATDQKTKTLEKELTQMRIRLFGR